MIRRRYLAHLDNAPGPFYVTRGAENVELVAGLMETDAGGPRFVRQPDDDSLDAVIAAASRSNGALRYAGRDRRVLARFREAGLEDSCDAPALQDFQEGPIASACRWVIARLPARGLRSFGKVIAGRLQAR